MGDPHPCAKKIALFPRRNAGATNLIVELDPGDTVNQARLMFKHIGTDAIASLLREKYWAGWPSFHLMFMSTGFFRPKAKLELLEYWSRWIDSPSLIKQWKREQFADAFAALKQLAVVEESDREEFERTTTSTRRGTIGFAPGVTLQWQLPLQDAAVLDDRGELAGEVRRAIDRAASVLQLRLPV